MLLTISATVPDERELKIIKDAGFDGVDYGFDDGASIALQDDFIDFAKKTKQTLDKIGLACPQTHATYFLKYGQDYDESNPEFLKVARSILATPYLGAGGVIVHPIDVPNGVDLMGENIKYFKALAPYAKKAGVKIAIENLYTWMGGTVHKGFINTPKAMNELLDNLSDDFVCCLDTGHAAITGVEPEDFIDNMDNTRLKFLHVHDTDYVFDRHLIPFMLNQHWDKITASLAKMNYGGTMNLEVNSFIARCGKESIKESYKISERVGRKLIKMIEDEK